MERKFLKIYWIENLQNIFIHWFLYEEFLNYNNQWDYYIIELNFKKSKDWKNLEYQNICDINKVYFYDEKDFKNFETTTYSNLPILKELFEVNSLMFEKINEEKIYEYKSELLKKFENHFYNKVKIDIRLWLISSICYYFTLKKNSIVNMNWFFSILNIKNIENDYEKISNYYKTLFTEKNLLNFDLNNYKRIHQFDEIWFIFHIVYLFLNWKNFEKRLFDDKDENYLSLLLKIILDVNKKQQIKEENYEYYISNILNNLDLDFYERRYLSYIKSKKIIDENSLIEYILIIILKWNFNLILNNPIPFQIKDELQEHVKLICYILKWILEWYKNLEKEIKIISYKSKIPDFILNKSSKKIEIKKEDIKYWSLIFKNY